MLEIKSASNPKFKYFKSLLDKKGRVSEYTVEGIKSVSDAISAGCDVSAVLVTEKQLKSVPEAYDGEIYVLADFLMEKMSDTKTPQGIVAVIRKNTAKTPELTHCGLYINYEYLS